MNILKYKYKAHKLINYLFYIIVFLVGFSIGFGAKKIDFNKLISQFLMIDNVSAYETTWNGYVINEEKIYNIITNKYPDFDISIYKNIGVYIEKTNGHPAIKIMAFTDDRLNSDIHIYNSETLLQFKSPIDDSYFIIYYLDTNKYFIASSASGFNFMAYQSPPTRFALTNYNIPGDNFNNINNSINKLDFSEYSVKLEFNENLFKDNPDFKQVCVENNKVFAITRATNSEVNDYFDYDYIWFPYGLDGLAKGLYDSSLDDKFSYYTEQDTFGYYWFKNKENIDNYFNNDIPGLELEMKGYTNKYSYYGWSAHYFRMYFEGENTQFTIFKFVNPTTLTYNDETNTNHGGGGLRLDGDEEIQISNNYCFYVKNEYEVQYINVDEWEDYYGTVITPNGDYDFNTSHNKNNSNTDNFLSQPISFINSMKDTISFINSLIYELYISLPVLLRTFIITLLIILIIMLIMRIGGYK